MSSGPLLAATVSTGLLSGLLTAFSAAVMPGLSQADDDAFVTVMAGINQRIINPVFIALFLGSLAWPVVVLVQGEETATGARGWVVAGLGLYLGAVGITGMVHVPLNVAMDRAAGTAPPAEITALRTWVEPRWVRWHHARTVLAAGSFATLAWALHLSGRVGQGG
ncbi:MAG TPA: anthrone oxygenase family protein [Euzebya sp.]|nr:anthrone oxygenase family protein [Euzebya sp.]